MPEPALGIQPVGTASLRAIIVDMPTVVFDEVVKGMERVTARFENVVKTEKLSGQLLDVRSGNLRRAIFRQVGALPPEDVVGTVGVDLEKAKYGRSLELGATITARNAKNLTIPLQAAQTASGVSRFTARQVIANPESFGYNGTFFRKGILFGTQGKQIVPLFVLKPSITLRPVGFLSTTAQDLVPWAVEQISGSVAKGLRKLGISSGEVS